MKKVVGYVRVSTTKDEQATSPENQRLMIRGECEREGWNLVQVYEDRASGTSIEGRPDFKQLENYLESNQVDIVMAADMSRWSRNKKDYFRFQWNVLEPLGIDLHLIRGINGEGDQVEMVRFIDIMMAERYSKELSRKVKDAHRELGCRGYWRSTIPFGYISSKVEDKDLPCTLQRHPENWPIVKRIFEMASSGTPYGQITKKLNAQGIPSPKGRQWCRSTIQRIATNPVYKGMVPTNDGYLDGAHTCVIDPSMWEAAQAVRPKNHGLPSQPGKYILTKLKTSHWAYVLDGDPEPQFAGLHGEMARDTRIYRMDSPARRNQRIIEPADELAEKFPKSVMADPLEIAVVEQLSAHNAPLLMAEISQQHQDASENLQQQLKDFERELTNCRGQKTTLKHRFDRSLDLELDDDAKAFSKELQAQQEVICALESKTDETRQLLVSHENSNRPNLELVTRLNRVQELYKTGQRLLLRKLLSAMVSRIDLRTDGENLHGTVYLYNLEGLKNGQRCGGGGIRTPVTGSTHETVFETAALNHSATPPRTQIITE